MTRRRTRAYEQPHGGGDGSTNSEEVYVKEAEKLWTVQQLAEYLGVPVATLYQWRTKRYGPPGLRIGKHIRYRPGDVERWLSTLDDGVA